MVKPESTVRADNYGRGYDLSYRNRQHNGLKADRPTRKACQTSRAISKKGLECRKNGQQKCYQPCGSLPIFSSSGVPEQTFRDSLLKIGKKNRRESSSNVALSSAVLFLLLAFILPLEIAFALLVHFQSLTGTIFVRLLGTSQQSHAFVGDRRTFISRSRR